MRILTFDGQCLCGMFLNARPCNDGFVDLTFKTFNKLFCQNKYIYDNVYQDSLLIVNKKLYY